jgi:hypothetical protein
MERRSTDHALGSIGTFYGLDQRVLVSSDPLTLRQFAAMSAYSLE